VEQHDIFRWKPGRPPVHGARLLGPRNAQTRGRSFSDADACPVEDNAVTLWGKRDGYSLFGEYFTVISRLMNIETAASPERPYAQDLGRDRDTHFSVSFSRAISPPDFFHVNFSNATGKLFSST
jgi:hypothetical protein